jgi:hypothetical protein
MRTLPNRIAPLLNITAKVNINRAKNTQPKPNNIPRPLANTASKRTPRVNSKSKF